jgi:hypothetical protein
MCRNGSPNGTESSQWQPQSLQKVSEMPLLDKDYNIVSSKAKSRQAADRQEYRTMAAGSRFRLTISVAKVVGNECLSLRKFRCANKLFLLISLNL